MKNKKALLAGALMVPALALTGGVAYATTGGPATPAQTTVTTTVQPTSHHPAGQGTGYRCTWRHGNQRCDQHGHPFQQPATQRHTTTQHHGYQGGNGHQGNWGYQGHGYQGGWGYQGHGYQGGWGYQGGYSGNYCGDGCGW